MFLIFTRQAHTGLITNCYCSQRTYSLCSCVCCESAEASTLLPKAVFTSGIRFPEARECRAVREGPELRSAGVSPRELPFQFFSRCTS